MPLLDVALGLTLSPLLAAQGWHVRRTVPKLPEVSDGREGSAGAGESMLRLLVLGDSAAVGVGVAAFGQSLAGQLVADLSRDHHLTWSVVARTGWTSADVLAALGACKRQAFDAAVISIGVNDVTSGRSMRAFAQTYGRLLDLLRDGFGTGIVIASALPPVGRFPALPQPLRLVLGLRAKAFDQQLRQLAAGRSGARYLPQHAHDDPAVMATDGFHPGPAVYARWASDAAAMIRTARAM